MEHLHCDVLVVGGGGAALRAALAAKEKDTNCRVLLVTKGIFGKSGTTANACSDRMAFHATLEHTPPMGGDAWRYHADDIYRIGGKVSDYDLAEILAKNSADAFYYLDGLGVPFVKKNGLPDQFVTDGSIYPRACYTGPNTAIDIERALVRRLEETDVKVKDHAMIYRLVKDQYGMCGAFGVTDNDEPFAVSAGAVVLATGGAGSIYRDNVFPMGATGDGYALALECGAPLVNMEFIQIGLCSRLTKLACSGSMMRAVPRLINNEGQEFLKSYFPGNVPLADVYNTLFRKGASWPVSFEHASHIIDIAVFKEIDAGKKVYLDFSKNPARFRFSDLSADNQKRYSDEVQCPNMEDSRDISPLMRLKEINPPSIQWLKERGIDLENGDKIEIMPAIQHFQGGIKIRAAADTAIPGLFAAGECAGGQHGANRPGGNSLLDGQVFGKIAGISAADYSRRAKVSGISPAEIEQEEQRIERIKRLKGDISCAQRMQTVQETMTRWASVVRTKEGLDRAVKAIKGVQDVPIDMAHTPLSEYFEVHNAAVTALAVLTAAQARHESRGPHLYFGSLTDMEPLPTRSEYDGYFVIYRQDQDLAFRFQKPVEP